MTKDSSHGGGEYSNIRGIRFAQSGGFAGLSRRSEATGADLSEQERRALERHAQESTRRSSSRGAAPAAAPMGRDLTRYEIELETEAGEVRLEFDDSNLPDDLAALVERLSQRSRPTPPGR